jgi:hypothetical protein
LRASMDMRGMFAMRCTLLRSRVSAFLSAVMMNVVVMPRRRCMVVRAVAAFGMVVTMRQNHFTHAVTSAILMGMRRRCRHDAKLRQGNRQNRRQEATHANHVQALNAVDYR